MSEQISPQCRLAVYGTLGPGKPNHHQVAELTGTWLRGRVRGRLVDGGWGASLGFPGIVLDPDAGFVDVELLQSADLPDHWERLDAFEGPGYRREVTTVEIDGVVVEACIYALADS